MILKTKRLILRPWREDDAEELYKYASDPEVGPPAGWEPHTSVENSREIIKTLLMHPDVYAVCLKENSKPIGNIHLNFKTDMSDREDECELGYWLGKPFWGQGIIPEAARELLRRAFEDLRANAVWCGRYDNNEKSRRVQEKLGFVYHHTTESILVPQMNELRTGHVMLMTKEMWKNIVYCDYLNRSIDEGLCCDIQMIANGYVLPSALTDVEIDKAKAAKVCEHCKHKMGMK